MRKSSGLVIFINGNRAVHEYNRPLAANISSYASYYEGISIYI